MSGPPDQKSQKPQQWANIGDFIVDQAATGARGFLIGEYHSRNASIQDITAEFSRLKKDIGLTTVYAEYVPRDMQDVLDSALNGDAASQLRLRSHMERAWGYGDDDAQHRKMPDGSTTTAQERYDSMFAAHAAGLRVRGVYTDKSDFKADVFDELRTTVGDAVAADVITKNDDGQPFLVMMGARHVQKGNEHNQFVDSEHVPDGLHALLSKTGIPLVSLDIAGISGPGVIKPSPSPDKTDYLWTARNESTPLQPRHPTLNFIGDMQRASDILISKSNSVVQSDPQEAGRVRVMSRDVAQVRDAYAECRVTPGMVDNLHDLAKRMVDAVPSLRMDEESYRLNKVIGEAAKKMTEPGRLTDEAACSPDTLAPALRPGPGR